MREQNVEKIADGTPLNQGRIKLEIQVNLLKMVNSF